MDYDAATKRGGANGSVRLAQELNRTPNKGIETAVRFCGELINFTTFFDGKFSTY